MPEQWSCGHCPLVVDIPDEQTCHPAYIDTILRIREHRFGHIADAFIAGTTEEIFGLCEDTPSGFGPYCPTEHQSAWFEELDRIVRSPVTSDDVAPALVEADMIVRGVR